MSVSFTVDQRGLQRAMTTYAVTRRKSDADVVNKAMRYVLPFAAKRVKDKTPGGAAIRLQLVGHSRQYSRGRKGQDALASSLAAAIIAGRIRKKQSNAVLPNRYLADKIDIGRINAFYDKVRIFVDAKVRSANFLRAGFIPAFRKFDVPNRGVNGQQHFKGRSRGIKAKPSLTGIAEAFATNQREGAFKIAPNAFRQAIRDTRRQFLKWLREDVRRDAIRSGFY